jgi:PQQ-dependent dehydrogenase (methanol/ethanol family)
MSTLIYAPAARSIAPWCLALAATAVIAIAACSSPPQQVDDARLRQADADTANWLTHGRTYSEQRHSLLKQINDTSITRLGLAWSVDMQTLHGLEATPLVKDGVMYLTGTWSVVYALDARTGAQKWKFDPEASRDHDKFMCCGVVNRGVALYRGRVYVGTMDGRLIALDEQTGKPVWSVQTTPADSAYSITGAPRIAGGKVIIEMQARSTSCALRVGLRCDDRHARVAHVWCRATLEAVRVRGAAERPPRGPANGGRVGWCESVGSDRYDPDLDLVYVGTANPSPWYPELRGTVVGDNLYGSSIAALNARTGEIVWHYQTTPGDAWDSTPRNPSSCKPNDWWHGASRADAGEQERVLLRDRSRDGQAISATPFASMTWATGIDSAGRPLIVQSSIASKAQGTVVTPANFGAHNGTPCRFLRRRLRLFAVVDEGQELHVVDPVRVASQRSPDATHAITGRCRRRSLRRIPRTADRVGPRGQARGLAVRIRSFGAGHAEHRGEPGVSGTRRRHLAAYRATDGKPSGSSMRRRHRRRTDDIRGGRYAIRRGAQWSARTLLRRRLTHRSKPGPVLPSAAQPAAAASGAA